MHVLLDVGRHLLIGGLPPAPAMPTSRARRLNDIGRPIANTQVYVLDPDLHRSRSESPGSCTSGARAWPAAI